VNNITKIIAFVVLIFFAQSCKSKSEFPVIKIISNYGDISIELYDKKAPITVASFLKNVEKGLYNNTSFYRVLKDEDADISNNYGIIQAGIWPKKDSINFLVHEPTNVTGLSHESGTISMASNGAGTATTEFFICIGNQKIYDANGGGTTDNKGFAAFGKVISGMDVVRTIQAQKNNGENFKEKIIINKIVKE
jgi:peptidyl-prolyl cis-trans isomerase A (cyclophilin A)